MTERTIYVKILDGTWKTGPNAVKIQNEVFKLKSFFDADKGYMQVYGTLVQGLGDHTCRIKCNDAGFVYCDKDGEIIDIRDFMPQEEIEPTDYEALLADIESDIEAMQRIRETFEMFEDIAETVFKGLMPGLVVSSPPGVGKTHCIEQLIKKYNTMKKLQNNKMYEVVSGYISPPHLYMKLYEHSDKGSVIIFDDCDDAFKDSTAANLLKRALDPGEHRQINWLAESNMLKSKDIPLGFEFHGSVIFLTNQDFEQSTVSAFRTHFDALLSRCHYLDMGLSSQRDQLLRIEQVVLDGMLTQFGLAEQQQRELVAYVKQHANHMRELSLRMAKKIAEVMKARPDDWETFVEASCMSRHARYKRLYEAKQLQVEQRVPEAAE